MNLDKTEGIECISTRASIFYRVWQSFLGVKSGGGSAGNTEAGRIVLHTVGIQEIFVYWEMLTRAQGDYTPVH